MTYIVFETMKEYNLEESVPAMDDSSIAGSYTTNDGMTFTYEASWTQLGSSTIWRAILRLGGNELGRPNGVVAFAEDAPAAVQEAAHKSIEQEFRLRM